MTWKDGRIKNAERKTEKIHFLYLIGFVLKYIILLTNFIFVKIFNNKID